MYNYSIKLINSQIYKKVAFISIILTISSIFFPIRHTFISKESFLTGGYSDFTSFSLYLSDIFLFITWGFIALPRGKEFYHVIKPLKWLILAIFIGFIYHFIQYQIFSLYFLLKWLELIVAYGTFVILFKDIQIKGLFLRLFVWLSGLQSFIAILQFYKQSSLGLYKLGESHLNPIILGVAKIVSHGTTYIRSYGTFPHPNPLSAILVLGILIACYLYLKVEDLRGRAGWGILIILNLIGLATTFSRGAFITLIFGLVIFLFYCLFKREKGSGGLSLVVMSGVVISIMLFKPYLLTRTSFTDQATLDRMFYNKSGVQMASKNPLLGVGTGESVLHMEQYSGKPLNYWEKQPPHNYFIITAAELGIPAMLALIWIFLLNLYKLVTGIKNQESSNSRVLTTYYLLLSTILASIILLMQFDHYFYTLQQTQIFLWIFLALVSSETKTLPQQGSVLS